MKPTDPLFVDCGPHGRRVSAVVCRHLLETEAVPAGFVENSDDPHDLQAWCHACEELFQAEGEMTEAFREFNDMAIVCVACYAEAKSRHTLKATDA